MPDTITLSDDGETILQEILANNLDEFDERMRSASPLPAIPPKDQPTGSEQATVAQSDKETHSQWALGGNGRYMPVGATVTKVPAGVYETFAIPGMWGLEHLPIASDGIYLLPDMATDTVLKEVRKFWTSEEKYRAHQLLYKRGLLLWGPPGGGKTVAVKLLMNELIKQDGIVIMASNIQLTTMCLKAIRRIEPKRNLIVVFEDIDEIISYNGESGVLSMLDGENNVDNVLNLATTNYPEKLGARIINRPSRFDRTIKVGMPTEEARKAYLEKATNGGLSAQNLVQWSMDTDGLSIAHLRELIAAVYCLDQEYDDVLKRLKEMATPIKGDDGFKSKNMGFVNKQAGRAFVTSLGGDPSGF